ncbi:MAG: MBL fold metallo-hydrolase [Calditrichaeota bacterium]|nr:MAG: MBL fold metallo-hydrolase [Calditrichota bacterium]
MLKVVLFPLQVNYVNSYLIYHPQTLDAFLVDCGAFEPSLRDFIKNNRLNLKFLLLTHSHYDHVDGVPDFQKEYKVPIYSANPDYDVQIAEGQSIAFDSYEIKILETPGHTDDSVSYYLEGAVFVGDAIFAGAVGGTSHRSNFETETRNVWEKIFRLPDETIIYPGHGAASTVAIERLYNPFFDQFV